MSELSHQTIAVGIAEQTQPNVGVLTGWCMFTQVWLEPNHTWKWPWVSWRTEGQPES